MACLLLGFGSETLQPPGAESELLKLQSVLVANPCSPPSLSQKLQLRRLEEANKVTGVLRNTQSFLGLEGAKLA